MQSYWHFNQFAVASWRHLVTHIGVTIDPGNALLPNGQAITRIHVNFSLVGLVGIHPRAIAHKRPVWSIRL